MTEACVQEKQGSYLFCDTDFVAAAASKRGGPLRISGAEDLRILSWKEVQDIVDEFESLNAYDRQIVKESILNLTGAGKEFEPRKVELKALGDEIEALKKQLDTQGPKLNDEARAALVKHDSKQKSLGRVEEDAQSDFGTQQNEIIQKILQKLIPVIDKYAKRMVLSLIMDGSKPWPEWPLVWASPSVDISRAVVDIYNANLGPPAASSTPRPSGTSSPNPETKPKRP